MSKGIKIDHGEVRPAGDGNGGAMIQSFGGGKSEDDANIKQTYRIDNSGNILDTHTTVIVGNQSWDDKKDQ